MKIKRHFRRRVEPRKSAGRWYVRVPADLWFKGNGSHRPHFGTLAEATKFARQLDAARQSSGAAFFALPMPVQTQLLGLIAKHGADGLIEADRWLNERKPKSSIGFTQLAADCIHAKQQAGRLREVTSKKMWVSINSFSTFCSKPIHSIVTEDVVGWLDYKGGSMESRKSRLSIIAEIFGFAVKNKTLSANPCDPIERPKSQLKEAKILSVDAIEKIVQVAEKHDPAMLGYLAPVIWGGLRHTEAIRLRKENVGAEVINLYGEQTKTGKRSLEITPVLRAWMSVNGAAVGSWSKKRWAKVVKLAGVTVPRNSLRKTCASMWLRLKGSRDAAKICGHSEAMLERNYKNANVTLADAERFASLRPAA
jgi:integrase